MVRNKSKSLSFSPAILLLLALFSAASIFLLSRYNLSFSKITSVKETKLENTQLTDLPNQKLIDLPQPDITGKVALEKTLASRRSRRSFQDKSLSLKQVSQLLWSMQGVTSDWGGRTAPSAKSVYPLDIYLIAHHVDDLESGIYHYIPGDTKPIHQLGLLKAGDFSFSTIEAALQSPAKNAPIVFVITGNLTKMKTAFDSPAADRNMYLEAGHAAQNLYLQVEALHLGTVVTGGFDIPKTSALIGISADQVPIYLIPVGYSAE